MDISLSAQIILDRRKRGGDTHASKEKEKSRKEKNSNKAKNKEKKIVS